MAPAAARAALIRLLQSAHAGEMAAALAYRGHGRATRDPDERARIREIEAEELHHRRLVGELLARLGAAPARSREFRARCIGGALGPLCFVAGWFAPMYGAGKLERGNIVEYENGARLARDCGESGMVECLLTMAEVEWEHERFFREKVGGHFLAKFFRPWAPPPAKAAIRASFAAEARDRAPATGGETAPAVPPAP